MVTMKGGNLNSFYILLLLGSITYATSCSKTAVTENELKAYMQNVNNGLVKQKTVKNINLKVLYKPSDLIAAQQFSSEDKLTSEEIKLLLERYDQYHYITLAVSIDNKDLLFATSASTFGNMINELAFNMDHYVKLISSTKDTLELVDFIYPRTFGLGGTTSLLFAFDKKAGQTPEWVTFYLSDFGIGTGNCKFKFMTRDILDTPEIKVRLL